LLAYLALHPKVSRERLAADLWPALDAEAQSHNLRVNLAHLRRVLEPDRAGHDASFLLRAHGGTLVLHPDRWLRTDVWQFDELGHQAMEAEERRSPSAALDAMRQAVALWRGDPRELENNDWALPDLEERRLRLVRMAVRAGELLLARDQPDAARRICERALQVDPWAETAHHVIIEAHLALGEHRAAARALERCQSALAEISPSAARTSARLQRLTRLVHPPPG
jgi:DNA-binding SARP family transcriptional activator